MKIEIPDKLFNSEELTNTPIRFKKFLEEYNNNQDFNFKVFENTNPQYNQMIILKNIEFYSLCSHHLLPFFGHVYVGYIPNDIICGVSKIARAVDKFASKPQLQERLTEEIANFLVEQLNPKGVIVIVNAKHLCMSMRGIKKQNVEMTTSAIRGIFEKLEVRNEFLSLIKM